MLGDHPAQHSKWTCKACVKLGTLRPCVKSAVAGLMHMVSPRRCLGNWKRGLASSRFAMAKWSPEAPTVAACFVKDLVTAYTFFVLQLYVIIGKFPDANESDNPSPPATIKSFLASTLCHLNQLKWLARYQSPKNGDNSKLLDECQDFEDFHEDLCQKIKSLKVRLVFCSFFFTTSVYT